MPKVVEKKKPTKKQLLKKLHYPVKSKADERRRSRARRDKVIEYTCVYKQQSMKGFRFEVPNIHGAKDQITKQLPYTELHFSFSPLIAMNEAPEVVYSQFTVVTNNQDVINKYDVGGTYSELPTNC